MDQDVLVWDEDFWDEDELVEDGYGIAVENNGPVTFRSPKNEWINFPPSAIDGVLIVKPGCFMLLVHYNMVLRLIFSCFTSSMLITKLYNKKRLL